MSNPKCSPFEHPNFLGTWWKCCECNTLNGDLRNSCKACSHQRCVAPETKTVPTHKEGGKIVVATVKVPSKSEKMN